MAIRSSVCVGFLMLVASVAGCDDDEAAPSPPIGTERPAAVPASPPPQGPETAEPAPESATVILDDVLLEVATSAASVEQLAESFGDRADDGRIMLYAARRYPDRTTMRFEVMLADGTVGIAGRGSVAAVVDGSGLPGRTPETRYDIVLDNLVIETEYASTYELMKEITRASVQRRLSREGSGSN